MIDVMASGHAALEVFLFALLAGLGWTLGCWVMARLLALFG